MGRERAYIDYSNKDFYKLYKEKYKGRDYNIPFGKYSELLNQCNQRLSEMIIEDGFDFNIPFRLGRVRIRIKKMNFKYLKPDWKATKELWKEDKEAKENKQLVFHLNDHSDNYRAEWFYDKRTANYKNKSVYEFIATRKNKRAINPTIRRNGIKKYYE